MKEQKMDYRKVLENEIKIFNEHNNGIISVRLVEAIEICVQRGTDTKNDPKREIKQYWDKEGQFLAEQDPHKTTQLITNQEAAWMKEHIDNLEMIRTLIEKSDA